MIRSLLACVLLMASQGAVAQVVGTNGRIAPQASGVDVRLRGISAVDGDIAWASGQKGTVLRTLDGGERWQVMRVAGADLLDFRDIEAFDADNAVILSIGPGTASRVYRTSNGGRNWILVLRNEDPRAFFDCMVFEGERGWMLGDPVDGKFQIHASRDRGRSWDLLGDGPVAEVGEAAFAASGTCIARMSDGVAAGSGGSASRIHVLRDGDDAWQAVDSSMGRAKQEAGVFSLAPTAAGVIAVGGDYTAETAPGNATQWQAGVPDGVMQAIEAPRGYRSGIACVNDALPCVAVGPSGADRWDGTRWSPLTDTGYDAVDLVGNVGWASGASGRIGRVELGD